MKRERTVYVGVGVVTFVVVLFAVQMILQTRTTAQAIQAGVYQVDPFWPKPLPNHWVFGSVVGLAVDSRDHVWVVHRGKVSIDPDLGAMMTYPPDTRRFGGGVAPSTGPISELCCTEAPPVVEFDPEGNVVGHWGAPGAGYQWPPSMHGITLDGKDNVWLAGNNGNTILKFSRDGKFLLQVGTNGASKGNTDTANFHNPAEVSIDDAVNEAYVADGYGNRRVVVIDATTGKFKRMWGAYGKPPVDPAPGELQPYDPAKPLSPHWRTVHCATLANDGLVYVCDRINARIQVFRKDGTFVKEMQIARRTRGSGVTFDIAFSPDREQRLMYVADGGNNRVWQLLREPMTVLNHIGDGGRYAGQFYGAHNVSLDTKGNMYTVETYSGARLQKFTYKGQAPVAKPEGPHN
jgi:DNA-binding beta-propeller fold protein YncE